MVALMFVLLAKVQKPNPEAPLQHVGAAGAKDFRPFGRVPS